MYKISPMIKSLFCTHISQMPFYDNIISIFQMLMHVLVEADCPFLISQNIS